MSGVAEPLSWTAADLVQRFGPMPLNRLRLDPPPGTATEEDVVRIHDQESRLYELVDAALLEKAMGTYESYLAGVLLRLLGNFVAEHDLGIVLGADGMLRLAPGLVRIPDVSFIPWNALPQRRIPESAIADLVPDLAVEVISGGNTPEEMDRKLQEYFAAGVREVWYVYPRTKTLHVYGSPQQSQAHSAAATLSCAGPLQGLTIELKELWKS